MPGRPCKCPEPENGSLPSAVKSNQLSEVRSWLAEATNDVNGADLIGFPLLYTACATNQKEVVAELLKRPELHLNPKAIGMEKYAGRDNRDFTPLCIAAYHGHEECIELLFNASLPCKIDPSVWVKHYGTATMIACDNNHWNVVSLIFRHQKKLSLEELDYLLPKARKNNQKKLIFTILYELFAKSVTRKEWSQATSLLKRIHASAELHVPLAKAAISPNVEEMRSILMEDHERDSVGALLAVAVEGSSEDVVRKLLRHGDFSADVLEHALLISTMNNNLEVLPVLLRSHFNSYRYATLSQARTIANEASFTDAERLLSNAIDACARGCINDSGVISQPNQRPPEIENEPLEIKTGRGDLVSLDDDCYQNDTLHRGAVVIFNYKEFEGKPELLREGSDADVFQLQDTFRKMGYMTQVHCNLTEDQTMVSAINFREQKRLQRVGSVVVVIMSHGVARQTFHTSDMQVFTVEKLLGLFSDRECPNLSGKAKIFLFNFCRGTDVSRPVYETDAVRTNCNDMLCVYSAQEGFVSMRHPVYGSPFIRSWCSVLANHAYNSNISKLLRIFTRRYSESVPGASAEIQLLNFTKEFWFMPLQKCHKIS